MSVSVTCPECQKSLKVRDDTVGKRIRCPGCSTVFVVPAEDIDSDDPFAGGLDAVVSASRTRRRVEEEDEEGENDLEEGRPRRPGRKSTSAGGSKGGGRKKSGGMSGLVIAGVVGGVVALLVCGGVLAVGVSRLGNGGLSFANWTTFRHPMGVAQVEMPGTPTLDKKDLADGAQTYAVQHAGYVMSFTAIQLPAALHANGPVDPGIVDLMFQEMERSTPSQFPGSRLISSRRITDAAYPGLELKLEIQRRFNSMRFFVVPGALVCVEFIAPTETGGAALRDRYFSSLRDSAGQPIEGALPSAASIPASQGTASTKQIEEILQKPFREARRELTTSLLDTSRDGSEAPEPPPEVARKIQYPSGIHRLSAYITNAPGDGKKHPAIVWISGGDCNSIDDGFFRPASPADDQTASAFWKAGIITMYPSLRGGNNNPGLKECFFGEVDDVIAAAEYLTTQDQVDPDRIYLGGHSTGGTLALLVSETTSRFRAVFSFGPTNDIRGYGSEFLRFDTANPLELLLRTPERWLSSIESPTFVLEGNQPPSNAAALNALQQGSTNPKVTFLGVRGATHFNVLAPLTELIARKIQADVGPQTNIAIDASELGLRFAN